MKVESIGFSNCRTDIISLTPCLRAESHAGFCHGGTATSLADDAVGHCAFCAMGAPHWGGATVQVNCKLSAAIGVGSLLRLEARVSRVEGRKHYIEGTLSSPALAGADGDGDEGSVVHCAFEGLSIKVGKARLVESSSGKSLGRSNSSGSVVDAQQAPNKASAPQSPLAGGASGSAQSPFSPGL